ncbi:TIGR02611 family protein [Corynebacterium sp. SCR221107]|uniref:TIGR02611 family protein n=1 Tax=Corynebacterium sp. SCR221107 TaxID=3017361 RepID=UPI0022EC4B79|nr:TIGR02611 family protein [Corynebacterium sp. SCR221107]WBT09233.1 TIGR02611 family protein [Corynebacterium sp. SCR221107]
MATMRDSVAEKVDKISAHHESLKSRRFGFLVRPLTLAIGWLVVTIGLVTIPFPGPGWLTVFVGVGVLSLEVHWAHRLLGWGVHKYEAFFAWYRKQSRANRYSIITATCAVAWVAVGGATFVAWKMGAIPALDPVIEAMVSS